jgi:hypothetical protein
MNISISRKIQTETLLTYFELSSSDLIGGTSVPGYHFSWVSSFSAVKMWGAVFHIDNDIYLSNTMQITIQQPPYN